MRSVVRIIISLLILHTGLTQAGQNWLEPADPLLSQSLLLDIARAGDHFVAVGERGHIILSADGERWQRADSPVRTTLTAVYFHDSEHGWAVGHDAVILKTVDGGRHWQTVYSAPDEEAPLLDIWFRDRDYGIAIGAYGLYLQSDDGGRTWQQLELQLRPAVVDADPAAADAADSDLVELYDLHLNAIAALASGDLVIAAEAGHIYHSDNAGQDWRELPSPYIGSFFGVLPLTDTAFAVFGLRGHIYRTDDLGQSWQELPTGSREMLNSAVRTATGMVIVAGSGGTLLLGDDGLQSLQPVEFPQRHNFAAVAVLPSGRLLLVGDNGVEQLELPDGLITHE